MRVSEDRFSRDLRRIELAKRLIALEVRTLWIRMWTGLTGNTVRNLYRSYIADQASPPRRRRGPPPSNPLLFLRSPALLEEASVLAALAVRFGVVPPEPVSNARRALAHLEVGERLCQAYELFRYVVPAAIFGMEQFMVLVFALAERKELRLDFCQGCQGVLLVDCLGRMRRTCPGCRSEDSSLTEKDPSEGSPPLPGAAFQQSLF